MASISGAPGWLAVREANCSVLKLPWEEVYMSKFGGFWACHMSEP